MMSDDEQRYVKNTFNEIADNYDEIELFKISAKHVGAAVKKYIRKKDVAVLDVACGTGNVVLECASFMHEASFDAIDISEGMLAKAKANAEARNLAHINFQLKDIAELDVEKKYHVITCSYALFFLPNPIKVLSSLVKRLRPKGKVIFTSFTAEAFEPSSEIIISLLRKYGSQSAMEYDMDKWENLKTKKHIDRLCLMSRVNDMEILTQDIRYDINLDEWWYLLNNTGYKGMLMELSTEDYEHVKNEYYEAMSKHVNSDGKTTLIADSYIVVLH